MKNILFPIISFMVLACAAPENEQLPLELRELENLTAYSSDMNHITALTFTKDATYGDTEDVLIGLIQDVTVDSLGRVFIADARQVVIHVFEPDGRYVTHLGRGGRGPGEFGTIKSLQIRDNRLYAFDSSQNRVNVIALDDLTADNTVLLAQNRSDFPDLTTAYPATNEVFVRADGTYIAMFITGDEFGQLQDWQNFEVNGMYYLLDSTGNIKHKLFDYLFEKRPRFPIRNVVVGIRIESFFGSTLIVNSRSDLIYLAAPDNFLIKIFSPDGNYKGAFYYPLKKVNLTHESSVKAEVPDIFTNEMNNFDLPEHWPVVTDLKIDNQDRLWVATTVEDMNVLEWWVLENTGELITWFEWPRSKPIQVIKNEYMYTFETDEETGLQQIVRYRIEFENITPE